MEIYQLAYSYRRYPGNVETWLIERLVPGELPYRLYFKGTRQEADTEVARLNAHARAGRDIKPE